MFNLKILENYFLHTSKYTPVLYSISALGFEIAINSFFL